MPIDTENASSARRRIAEALRAWAEEILLKLSRKSKLATAFRYTRSRWKGLLHCLDDGCLALDNNPAERALRWVAIGRRNYLFAVPIMAAVGLRRFADHPASPLHELLPWNWKLRQIAAAAA